MLASLIRVVLHHPRLVAALGAVFLIYGALLARTETFETFPALSPARTSVETEAPGLVAEQVEQLVTRPIENALGGARGVAAVHSQSVQGLSIVTLDFQPDTPPDRVRQAISEGLVQTAGLLPAGVGAPRLGPMTLVILGGLATSTLLGLTVLPSLVILVWRPKPGRAAGPDPAADPVAT